MVSEYYCQSFRILNLERFGLLFLMSILVRLICIYLLSLFHNLTFYIRFVPFHASVLYSALLLFVEIRISFKVPVIHGYPRDFFILLKSSLFVNIPILNPPLFFCSRIFDC